MDKAQIAKKLRLVRPQLSPETRQAVSADIYYSGEPETVLADLALIDKLISSYQEKVASKGGNRAVAARDPNTCPECQIPNKLPFKLSIESVFETFQRGKSES